MKAQRRRDARIAVEWRASAEKIVELDQELDSELAKVYERVKADPEGLGVRKEGLVRDISVNGAFIEADPLPLLSRIKLSIEIPDYRAVDAVGWVLWRRTGECAIRRADGNSLTLPAGYGLIFEWISLESRLEIARRVVAGG